MITLYLVQATPSELENAHLELWNDQDSRDQVLQPSAPEQLDDRPHNDEYFEPVVVNTEDAIIENSIQLNLVDQSIATKSTNELNHKAQDEMPVESLQSVQSNGVTETPVNEKCQPFQQCQK